MQIWYAHAGEDLRVSPSPKETLCTYFHGKSGRCIYGDHCRYIHDVELQRRAKAEQRRAKALKKSNLQRNEHTFYDENLMRTQIRETGRTGDFFSRNFDFSFQKS